MEQAVENKESQIDEQDEFKPLTLEQLTVAYGYMKTSLDRLVKAHNDLTDYVNNLHENPSYVAGLIGHINALHENRALFFVQVYSKLSLEEQSKCYRLTLREYPGISNPEEMRILDRYYVEVECMRNGVWEEVPCDDELKVTMFEAFLGRLMTISAQPDETYFATLTHIEPAPQPDGEEDDCDE